MVIVIGFMRQGNAYISEEQQSPFNSTKNHKCTDVQLKNNSFRTPHIDSTKCQFHLKCLLNKTPK